MLLRFCVFMFLLSQVQITASSFETNKISLFSSQSSQKQKGQSITQDDKTTDTNLSLVQVITKISETTNNIEKMAISLEGQTTASLDQIERNQKIIMAQNEENLKILHRIVDKTERIEAHQQILLTRQNACCIMS